MGTWRLRVIVIAHYLKSRRIGTVLASVVALELSLPLWAGRAFKVTHDMVLRAVPLAVPIQFLIVALLLYVVASEFSRMERVAARPMRAYQLVLWVTIAAPVLGATVIASVLIGDSGTLGALAPLKALVGLWGIGLIATTLMDRRVAGIVPIAAIILPMILSPNVMPGVQFWGFVMEPDSELLSWGTAIGLLVAGVWVHTFWSDRRRR